MTDTDRRLEAVVESYLPEVRHALAESRRIAEDNDDDTLNDEEEVRGYFDGAWDDFAKACAAKHVDPNAVVDEVWIRIAKET